MFDSQLTKKMFYSCIKNFAHYLQLIFYSIKFQFYRCRNIFHESYVYIEILTVISTSICNHEKQDEPTFYLNDIRLVIFNKVCKIVSVFELKRENILQFIYYYCHVATIALPKNSELYLDI